MTWSDADEVMCGFCGHEQTDPGRPGWLHHEPTSYGPEDAPMRRAMWLCPFCASSLGVAAWLSGSRVDTTTADMATLYHLLSDLIVEMSSPTRRQ